MVPPVVDMSWVEENGDRLVLADVRWYLDGRSGREAYESGHLPGAVFVDLDKWLSGDPRAGRGRHPLPGPDVFATGMSLLGIADGTTVVGYDDQGGVVAARLVWMLRATGHDAALLDGGLQCYEGPLETGGTVLRPAHFTARPWPLERLADIDDATNAANVVLDARSTERYHGQEERVDPRAGHIPRAVSLPCRGNLDHNGRFLPVRELRDRFESAGVPAGTSVVSYCGSGVTACHNLLAMELCGLGHGRLYPGSWSEYSSRPDRPVAT
ncbi:MAG TPA: sulfurtransferase [Acidimicrobiales bacterium]|nr:sulfurtransferase [Acidimicrobiales bacterium]